MNQHRFALRALAAPFALCALATLPAAARAQAAPPAVPAYGIGDAIKESQPPRPPAPARAPAPVIVEPDRRPLALPAGETLAVKDFRLEGVQYLPEAELLALLTPWRNRELGMADIEAAAERITARYRERGYLVAYAYVPRQDASAGTLTLRIVVGKLGRVALANRSPVRDSLVDAAFDPLRAEGTVARATLERAMLLVSDLPGAALPKVTLAPGAEPGSSDVDVDIDAGRRVTGYVLGDNHGSRYTGRARASAGVEVASPFGLGDRFGINALASRAGGLLNGRAAYSLPLNANGLRAEVAASKTTYELGGDYRDLDASGSAHGAEATLSYPLLRSRDRNLSLSLGAAARRMRDDIAATSTVTPKKANAATLAAQYEAWGSLGALPAYAGLNLGLTEGRLDITDESQKALNRAGADTTGGYGRLNLALTGNLELGGGWSALGNASTQKALRDKNLDPSEQMGISGPSGVKAYREWVSGDNGYLLNAELRRALPAVGGLVHSVGAFADLGRAALQKAGYTATTNGVRLADVGLGYQLRWESVLARVQLARAVGPEPATLKNDSRTRLLFQAGLAF
ncbi:ShlB/FhaC/HecB family hemolysin secretion/activation protein [Derxia lacustris]|uniref:ShlB/FhaC/HecB family hemolysin secretion/activation protein n=1 Tax=Derxia lacustris TaxID=764842 RepID=UPI001592F67D|nr:ShlB/FhaC/HecB family hemolysin secretion/activation protein [Derxia lacustris]